MISSVYANQMHQRTRSSTYKAQRSLIKVTLVKFVKRPVPVTVLWNRAQCQVLAVKATTAGGGYWCKINIGAGMTHWMPEVAA